MSGLKSKRVLVTAGGQGIGLAICRELVDAGCDVVAHYHTTADGAREIKERASAAGVRAEILQADLTEPDLCRRMVDQAVEFLGGLDILINNAGGLIARRTIEELDPDFWRQSIDLNMSSIIQVTRHAVPHLAEAGGASIVNISSLAGRKGGHGGSLAYSTTKGAVLTFTRALAAELGPRGIRVNAVAPGLILGTRFHATHTTPESARETIAGIPLGRAGTPEDVARAVVYLASEYDGFITGATVDINGGVYCA
jgi:3-oxoacyl-[acyl-carrier protein] reductase